MFLLSYQTVFLIPYKVAVEYSTKLPEFALKVKEVIAAEFDHKPASNSKSLLVALLSSDAVSALKDLLFEPA